MFELIWVGNTLLPRWFVILVAAAVVIVLVSVWVWLTDRG